MLNLVLLLVSLERMEDAEAVATESQSAAAFHEVGLAFGRVGRHAEAARSFAACLELEPDHPTARMNLEYAQRAGLGGP